MVNLVWFTLLVKFESWCWRKSNSVPKTTFFERKLSWIWLTVSKTRMSDFKKNDFDFRNISNNALPLSKLALTRPDFLQNPDDSLVNLKKFNFWISSCRFPFDANWPTCSFETTSTSIYFFSPKMTGHVHGTIYKIA